MISVYDCIHGNLYRVRSRNLDFGVFDSENCGFIGIREKFGSRYLFTEYHHDIGPPYGTASPQEDLGPCPIEEITEGVSFEGRWHTNEKLFAWLDETQLVEYRKEIT